MPQYLQTHKLNLAAAQAVQHVSLAASYVVLGYCCCAKKPCAHLHKLSACVEAGQDLDMCRPHITDG